MDKKGITLVELLIVIGIIGILAVIAIPAYIGQQKRAARTEAYSNLENLRLLQGQYYADNGEYAPNNATANSTSATTLLYGVFSGTTYDTSNNPTNDRNVYKWLSGFKPGLTADLNYNYEIEYTVATTAGVTTTTGFTAHAKGKSGKSVSGDDFTINQDNVKSGW